MDRKDGKMRIVSVRVTDFGCFHDSTEVAIDDVTALIAENENGKSTFLRALAWWGDASAAFDEEDLWEGADPEYSYDHVAITLETNPQVTSALNSLGVKNVPAKLKVTRDSNGSYAVTDAATGASLVPQVDTKNVEASREALIVYLNSLAPASDVATYAKAFDDAKVSAPALATAITSTRSALLPTTPPIQQPTLEQHLATLETNVKELTRTVTGDEIYKSIAPHLPQFIYFDDTVDFVQDSVAYTEVAADPSKHRTMINLATVAGVDLISVAKDSPHKRQRNSERAKVKLSTDFSKYWQGEPVTVYIQLDESQMTLTMRHKGRTQRPSRRSSGLKWQLGFFVNFTAEVRKNLASAVLLLDEPGLHLHIKQQPKLLELFDDLARNGCGIIYATHLSHMLAPDKPHSYRLLVADETTPNATRVLSDIKGVSSKLDVMKPVRQALGMGIADAIGLGGTNVIAEGWAERYVLLEMSQACRKAGEAELAPGATVLPAGGSGKKILPFAAMAVAENTHVVVLADDDKAGQDTVKEIDKTFHGGVPVVRTHEATVTSGFELEDLFDRSFYVELVNDSHADVPGYSPLSATDLDPSKPICDATAAAFKQKKLGSFQKLKPAMELQKWRELGKDVDTVTLANFADLFMRLNKAIATN